MRSPRRVLPVVLLTAVALGSPMATTALGKLPSAMTGSATSTTDHSAVVTAQVVPETKTTDYQFEYGTTTAYGQSTSPVTLTEEHVSRTVTVTLEGLAASTTYHFRVKAINKEGVVTGGDRTFATAPAATSPAAPGVNGGDGSAQPPEDLVPAQGRSVVVAPVSGMIKIQAPGSNGFTTLAAGDAVPVGSVVDARAGTVALTSAVGDGTQTGHFRGAVFQVRQAAAGSGMTDIVLRGGDFGACASGRTARASARRKPPVRRLWGHDDAGKFRTHGRNSVATVRGTSWVTTDTCAGTRTRVTEGAVSVRDLRRKRTVLVRAGQSYLARSHR